MVCSVQPSSEYMQLHFSEHKLFFVHLHFRITSIFAKSRVSRCILDSTIRIRHVHTPIPTIADIDCVQHVYADFSITSALLSLDTRRRPNSISRVASCFLVYTFNVNRVLFSKTNWTFLVWDHGYTRIVRLTKTRRRNIPETRAIRFYVVNNARSA